MLDHDLEPEDRSVRGSLVLGLSNADIHCLDVFEGDVRASLPMLKPPLTDHVLEIRNTLGREFRSIPLVPSYRSRLMRSRDTESSAQPGKRNQTSHLPRRNPSHQTLRRH